MLLDLVHVILQGCYLQSHTDLVRRKRITEELHKIACEALQLHLLVHIGQVLAKVTESWSMKRLSSCAVRSRLSAI